LGVVGSGRIGQHVIRLARAFDMKVLAYDTKPQPFLSEILRFTYVPLDELLAAADIISLHIPLGGGTHHLLDRLAFGTCKPGVVLINTARGGLVDTEALIEALDNGTVSAAGLDVMEEERVLQQEPARIIGEQIVNRLHSGETAGDQVRDERRVHELSSLMRNNQLLSHPNVVFTPHVAFNSVEAVRRINETTLENIRGFVSGREIERVPGSVPAGT
jgi:D-lactate dehydrogenase